MFSKLTEVAGNVETQMRLVLEVTGGTNLTIQRCFVEVPSSWTRFTVDVAGTYVGFSNGAIKATDIHITVVCIGGKFSVRAI